MQLGPGFEVEPSRKHLLKSKISFTSLTRRNIIVQEGWLLADAEKREIERKEHKQ